MNADRDTEPKHPAVRYAGVHVMLIPRYETDVTEVYLMRYGADGIRHALSRDVVDVPGLTGEPSHWVPAQPGTELTFFDRIVGAPAVDLGLLERVLKEGRDVLRQMAL